MHKILIYFRKLSGFNSKFVLIILDGVSLIFLLYTDNSVPVMRLTLKFLVKSFIAIVLLVFVLPMIIHYWDSQEWHKLEADARMKRESGVQVTISHMIFLIGVFQDFSVIREARAVLSIPIFVFISGSVYHQ